MVFGTRELFYRHIRLRKDFSMKITRIKDHVIPTFKSLSKVFASNVILECIAQYEKLNEILDEEFQRIETKIYDVFGPLLSRLNKVLENEIV
jgi:regulator of PEP synthase PpsR (kinase-PPPase family)